ncbi:MAG TPA: shikimate kinase [Elusimicrobiota bacterium]|nr:shikimate kinase [Elusimicrobiota bacterium]
MNIVLTGFMGSGKSAVGKILADRLKWTFYDTDVLIEKEAGVAISTIFAKKGEPAFRDMETRTVQLLGLLDKCVIATGGGIPLRPQNMDELERNGKVFFLRARPETLLERLRDGIDTRPLLKGKDPLLAVEELLRSRQKAYARCHHVIDTDGLSAEEVAEKIIGLMFL